MRASLCVLAVAASLVSLAAVAADVPPDRPAASLDVPPRPYMAVPLDREGRLAEAIPLYRVQAETTASKADRLRYAGALLRAGRADDAQPIYEQVSADASSSGGATGAEAGPAICASSLLTSGFPARAVPYARQAQRLRTEDPTLLLLLVRALAASGDTKAARAALQPVAQVPGDWTIGQRIELARWQWLIGNEAAARQMLRGKPPAESIGQMFRDSILANAPFQKGDWSAASEQLAACARKAPTGLGNQRVARVWRNAQRELWWVQLRRAVSLWEAGDRDAAAAEAAEAQRSDEEYVRSAASLFLVAVDLTHGQGDAAQVRLRVLAGHDVRFTAAAEALAATLDAGGDVAPAARAIQAALGPLDRSADFVTQPLSTLVADAARSSAAPGTTGRTVQRTEDLAAD
jgi:hypothetical protein